MRESKSERECEKDRRDRQTDRHRKTEKEKERERERERERISHLFNVVHNCTKIILAVLSLKLIPNIHVQMAIVLKMNR